MRAIPAGSVRREERSGRHAVPGHGRRLARGRLSGAWSAAAGALLAAVVAGCQGTDIPKVAALPTLNRAEVDKRIGEIAGQMPFRPSDARRIDEWENLNFHIRKLRHILSAYYRSVDTDELLNQSLQEAERTLRALYSTNAPALVTGKREEAYYSDNDGSFQPFLRYVPEKASREGGELPMVVFLHGYSPMLDIANWAYFPASLVEFAEEEGFLLVAPFGRSNTDFQGIGEQDVLNAIGEMQERYPVDDRRIILAGYSMGGMGVWTIGAHQADLFAGLVVVSGRGDYYFWKKQRKEDLPLYKTGLVDEDFGHSQVTNLTKAPVLSFHGLQDSLVRVDEGRHMAQAVRDAGGQITYVEVDGDHWIAESVFRRGDVHKWMTRRRREAPGLVRPQGDFSPTRCGPIKRAFLSPFIFVCTATSDDGEEMARFEKAAFEWYRFAKAFPRVAHESRMPATDLTRYNLFAFGEPEDSVLIKKILYRSPVEVTGTEFVVGGKHFPREGNGLYVVRRNPWNAQKLAVVQCGAPWGRGLPDNHKYDLLPDYIVYSEERDEDGSNRALCAGFFDDQWRLDPARMYVRPADALSYGTE